MLFSFPPHVGGEINTPGQGGHGGQGVRRPPNTALLGTLRISLPQGHHSVFPSHQGIGEDAMSETLTTSTEIWVRARSGALR